MHASDDPFGFSNLNPVWTIFTFKKDQSVGDFSNPSDVPVTFHFHRIVNQHIYIDLIWLILLSFIKLFQSSKISLRFVLNFFFFIFFLVFPSRFSLFILIH